MPAGARTAGASACGGAAKGPSLTGTRVVPRGYAVYRTAGYSFVYPAGWRSSTYQCDPTQGGVSVAPPGPTPIDDAYPRIDTELSAARASFPPPQDFNSFIANLRDETSVKLPSGRCLAQQVTVSSVTVPGARAARAGERARLRPAARARPDRAHLDAASWSSACGGIPPTSSSIRARSSTASGSAPESRSDPEAAATARATRPPRILFSEVASPCSQPCRHPSRDLRTTMAGDPQEIRRYVHTSSPARRKLGSGLRARAPAGRPARRLRRRLAQEDEHDTGTTWLRPPPRRPAHAKPVASGYYTVPWTNGPNSYKVSDIRPAPGRAVPGPRLRDQVPEPDPGLSGRPRLRPRPARVAQPGDRYGHGRRRRARRPGQPEGVPGGSRQPGQPVYDEARVRGERRPPGLAHPSGVGALCDATGRHLLA